MEVVWFKEITGRDREDDIDTNRRQRRTFQAITDTAEGGPDQVLAFADVPTLGDFLQYVDESTGLPVLVVDFTLVVNRRRAEQNDAENLCNWTVTIEYVGIDEPESQPAEVEFSPTRFQEHVVDDANGTPVLNAARDPLIEGVVRDRTRYTLQIIKNISDADWDPIDAETYQDSLNEAAFLVGYYPANPAGFAPGTCKLTLTAKRMRKVQGVGGFKTFYWVRTATIDIDRRGWNAKVRNAGFRYFDEGLNDWVKIVDPKTGQPVTTPALLDAGGALLLPDGTPTICNPPDGFVLYETKDWSTLGLEY